MKIQAYNTDCMLNVIVSKCYILNVLLTTGGIGHDLALHGPFAQMDLDWPFFDR